MVKTVLLVSGLIFLLCGLFLVLSVEAPPKFVENWKVEEYIQKHRTIALVVGILLLVIALAMLGLAFMQFSSKR